MTGQPDPGCPCRADDPIPLGLPFLAADYRASWLLRNGARQRRCPSCGLWTVWTKPTSGKTPPWIGDGA